MKKTIAIVLLFLLPLVSMSQDDLLAEIDKQDTTQFAEAAFKGLKIVNLESTKLAAGGSLVFCRFSSLRLS